MKEVHKQIPLTSFFLRDHKKKKNKNKKNPHTNGQIIKTETLVLNDPLDEMDLIDIFRTVHANTEEYTFFSSAHGTFSRIGHILGHKSNFSKFKKTEIVSSIFSDHNSMRLDINYKKKKTCKKHKHMEIKHVSK